MKRLRGCDDCEDCEEFFEEHHEDDRVDPADDGGYKDEKEEIESIDHVPDADTDADGPAVEQIPAYDWGQVFAAFMTTQAFARVTRHILPCMSSVLPPIKDILRAFEVTPFESVKVVILGQDPYHGVGQATGLAFSVRPGVRTPPSLQNILLELVSDTGISKTPPTDLEGWARQGVLLLNTTLTVLRGKPRCHSGIGWSELALLVIRNLSARRRNLVFMLWGNDARRYAVHVDGEKHLVIESVHPSPYSARHGFFGSKPFSRCNAYLRKNGIEEIDWSL